MAWPLNEVTKRIMNRDRLIAWLLLGGGTCLFLYWKRKDVIDVAGKIFSSDQDRVRAALRSAARTYGINPDIMDALGKVETGWKLGVANLTGTDLARGGSWGPTQISEKTARAYGYAGDMQAINTDPELSAQWTAIILAARPGGAPLTIEDASAWWNAGRTSASVGTLPASTRDVYIPRARTALALVQSLGEPQAA